MYGGEILHADLRGACKGNGLDLMSIGVIIGKKTVLLDNIFSHSSKPKTVWRPSVVVPTACTQTRVSE